MSLTLEPNASIGGQIRKVDPRETLPGSGESVLVDGSTGDAELDREILATLAGDRTVLWRSVLDTQIPHIAEVEPSVQWFDAEQWDAAALVAAFGVDCALFLDDSVMGDSEGFQRLLRSAPGLVTAALLGHIRPESIRAGSERVTVEELDVWVTRDRQRRIPEIATFDSVDVRVGVVSIVIPVHGLWEFTERCIAAIDQTAGSREIELVVVDDASPDDTAERLRRLETTRGGLTVVTNEVNLGFPTSVNLGIAASSGEFVCVLNNDTEPTPGWLEEMLDTLDIDGTMMVGPRSNNISGLQQIPDAPSLADPGAHAWALRWTATRSGRSWRTDRLVGFALLTRRSTLVEHGGFDEAFGRGNYEDDDLSARLLAADGDLRVADGAVVLHHGSATFASLEVDYLAHLDLAARHLAQPVDRHRHAVAVLVLADSDADGSANTKSTEQTVWSALGLASRVVVAERGPTDELAVRLAPLRRFGVEVWAVDWTQPDCAMAIVDELGGAETVIVLSSGERVEVTDWGTARAEVELLDGKPIGVRVDGVPQIRGHAPDDQLLDLVGTPAEIEISSIHVVTDTAARAASPSTTETGGAVGTRVVELAIIVLSEGDPDATTATVGSASAVGAPILVVEREGAGPVDDALGAHPNHMGIDLMADEIRVLQLDWADGGQLRRLVESVAAQRMLVLGAGERLVLDPAGWAADRCLDAAADLAVQIGDSAEVRLTEVKGDAVQRIGTTVERVTTDVAIARGIRIVPADLPFAELIAIRHASLGSASALAAASQGDPSAAERLAEVLVLDEELRLLEQIRTERPVDWSMPIDQLSVGAVIAFDPAGDDVNSLAATLRSLMTQGHPIVDAVVVTSPDGLGLVEPLLADPARVEVHHGLSGRTNSHERRALLYDLGSLLVRGDWIAMTDIGDVLAPDHVEHLLSVAVDDRSEFVHSLVAVEQPPSEAGDAHTVELSADLQSRAGTIGPMLFASEYRALRLRPSAVAIPEYPTANRTDRLRALGVVESAAERVTASRPHHVRRRGVGSGGHVAIEPDGLALHLGCGPNLLPGWTNIDLEEEYGPDLVHDLSGGLPFEDASVDFVHSEHFFEHLSLADGVALMSECHRVLRPGGVLRIAMPDLESTVHAYLGDWRAQAWVADYPRLDTAAHMLNMGLREWGHRYVYDLTDLTLRLRSIGFATVDPMAWGGSSHPELRDLETRPDSILVVEATR